MHDLASEFAYAVTMGNNILFYAFISQVISPASWIVALIVHMSKFIGLNVKDNACVRMDEEWLRRAFFLFLSAIVVAAMVMMAGLYSRIVYTLWFKGDQENQLTFQQRVSINKQVQTETFFLFCFPHDQPIV